MVVWPLGAGPGGGGTLRVRWGPQSAAVRQDRLSVDGEHGAPLLSLFSESCTAVPYQQDVSHCVDAATSIV